MCPPIFTQVWHGKERILVNLVRVSWRVSCFSCEGEFRHTIIHFLLVLYGLCGHFLCYWSPHVVKLIFMMFWLGSFFRLWHCSMLLCFLRYRLLYSIQSFIHYCGIDRVLFNCHSVLACRSIYLLTGSASRIRTWPVILLRLAFGWGYFVLGLDSHEFLLLLLLFRRIIYSAQLMHELVFLIVHLVELLLVKVFLGFPWFLWWVSAWRLLLLQLCSLLYGEVLLCHHIRRHPNDLRVVPLPLHPLQLPILHHSLAAYRLWQL